MKQKHRSAFLQDVQDRQKNTIWPDTFRNRLTFERFLAEGSPNATKGQRIGLFVCGLGLLLTGVMAIYVAGTGNFPFAVFFFLLAIGVGFMVMGILILLNAFRRVGDD